MLPKPKKPIKVNILPLSTIDIFNSELSENAFFNNDGSIIAANKNIETPQMPISIFD